MNNFLNTSSLAATIDNLNQLYFDNKKVSATEKNKTAKWIASRQGLPGSYWGMFAPTESDFKGIQLFTGEKVTTRAGISHILGEETCRLLILLDNDNTKQALENAQDGLKRAMKNAKEKGYNVNGFYCCGKCTPAYWRNLSAQGIDKNNAQLNEGMKILKRFRDGEGRWKKFPFYYTLLSLSDIDLPAAREEMRYASGICECLAKTSKKTDLYGIRRRQLMEKILELI